MEIRPLTGALGAEIIDADIRDPKQFDQIFEAFTNYSVIAIRDQTLSPEDQIVFAERFGQINVNRFFAQLPGYEKVAIVLKEPDQKRAIGENWHTDHSYDQAPAMCSILHCIETPEVGGDTMFASMYAAFDALSEGMKDMLRQMKVWHSSRHAFGQTRQGDEASKTGRIGNPDLATQDALHPVVIRHPLSGREALYVNRGFTTHFEGWSAADSQPLLSYLYTHGVQPEFTCRLRYRPGTVVMWDNRATWHKAINDYDGHRRLMHRITVEGPELAAALAA
ncbi:MAG: TauD/TfdA dioxygenase family protein [Paracoccaceae bacterium]